MSFYLDDNDDDEDLRRQSFGGAALSSSQKTEENDMNAFVCDNCGGFESYMDDTTGVLTCVECYTQSQTQIAASQEEVDFDEAMILAGRASDGHLLVHAGGNRKGRGAKANRPFQDDDQTVPLPKVQDCIRGMQRVLIETSRIVCDLAGGTKDDHKNVRESVKNMWKAYLESWMDGADYFGKLYPEVRFCFRDSFLNMHVRTKVLKTLAYLATKRLREQMTLTSQEEEEKDNANENNNNNNNKTNKIEDDEREQDMYDSEEEENGNNSENDQDSTSHPDMVDHPDPDADADDDISQSSELTSNDIKEKKKPVMRPMLKMIYNHYKLKGFKRIPQLGRKEAALMIQPSMTMVAGILWIAVAPLGVTGGHLREWIGNGSLPLLNAYYVVLPPKEQKLLKAVRGFFRSPNPPSMFALKKAVRTLHVACGYKPRKIIVNKKGSRKRMETMSSRDFSPGRLMTPACVPIMTARLVADLGLSQFVLNYSLALMGQAIICNVAKSSNDDEDDEDFWLPRPLARARPDRLLDPARILGVMVVACKLLPDWEKLCFLRPGGGYGTSNSSKSSYPGESNNDRPVGHDAKRCKTLEAKGRFIPWTQEYFRMVAGNGTLTEDYLEFLEEELIEPNDTLLPGFVSSLFDVSEKSENNSRKKEPLQQQMLPATPNNSVIVPCQTLLSVSQTAGIKKRKMTTTIRYEVTENPDTKFVKPISGPLGPLVEYMALKSGVLPSDIIEFVAELDKELVKQDQWMGSNYPVKTDSQVAYNKVFRIGVFRKGSSVKDVPTTTEDAPTGTRDAPIEL
jgi:hypothetical protein